MESLNTMKYVGLKEFGKPSVMCIEEGPIPKPKEGEVLLKLVSTALNRADCVQRSGNYAAPAGDSPILGLEGSGYIIDADGKADVSRPVMALLPGGGYAQYAVVPKDHVMDIPKGISVEDGAAIPEVWLTALKLLNVTKAQENDWVLIYGAASGVGTAATQLVKKYIKGNVVALAGSDEKCLIAKNFGADVTLNYKTTQNLAGKIREATGGKGVNVILDCIGAQNFELSISSIALDGRWVIYGFLGGPKLENVNIAPLLRTRASLFFSTLRSRTIEYKADLVNQLKKLLPQFETGELKISVDSRYQVDWSDAKVWQETHTRMEANENAGKILMIFK